jgi:nicotinate-nucleotide adenylyltransferase
VSETGFFGGQFDPPHNGHLEVVRTARRQLDLDRMLIVPDRNPTHRGPSVQPADVRLRLAAAAFGDQPDVEVLLPDTGCRPEYTVNVLARLAGLGRLHLIIGADQYAGFERWHDPDRIRRLARIVVAPRPGFPVSDPRVHVLDMPPLDLSSTDLREALARGEDAGDRIPAAAWAIIQAEQLYRGAAHPETSSGLLP